MIERETPAFEACRDEFLHDVRVALEVVVAGEDRCAHRRNAVVGESVYVELCALRFRLNLIRIDRSEHGVHLTLQQRRDHRCDRHVDHVDVRLLQIVRFEQQRQHRRLR